MKYAICAADTFSLGVGYLISHLRSMGHEVKLIFDPDNNIVLKTIE